MSASPSGVRSPLRSVVAVVLLLCGGFAVGQAGGWTIQVMALRDYSEAASVVTDLEELGFDAYSEFAMRDGRQFVRVRVGCFAGREAAADLASAMASVVTKDAVPVPITQGADIAACVEIDIGFLKPSSWRQLGSGSGRFEVVVGGEAAQVAHTGERWSVLQSQAETPATIEPASQASFHQAATNGLAIVQIVTERGPFNLCRGLLLAQVADAAIVERGDAVVACRLLTATGGRP